MISHEQFAFFQNIALEHIAAVEQHQPGVSQGLALHIVDVRTPDEQANKYNLSSGLKLEPARLKLKTSLTQQMINHYVSQ